MIGPEIDHHFVQLALRQRCARDREVHELARELAAGLLLGPGLVESTHAVGRSGGELALAALALGVEVQVREVAAIEGQDLEAAFALAERGVVDPVGVELPLDPAGDACRRDPVGVTRAGPVREAVERVQGGVVGGEGGHARGHLCALQRQEAQSESERARQGATFHAVILTHSLRRKLTP